jgi:hypothetical protein
VIFPYMHVMYFDQIHPPLFFIPSPFEIILMGFIILFLYMHMKYFTCVYPPHTLFYSSAGSHPKKSPISKSFGPRFLR